MEKQKLEEILRIHAEWLEDSEKGERADLWGADLRGAYLREADLRGADLREADLREADLWGAYLQGADLREADLRGADLREAYLRGAYLQGADLQEADLQGADLQGADLQEAENIFQFGPMPTSRRIVTANWHGAEKGWIVYAGCFTGGLDELEAAVKAEHNCPVYLGIIEMLRKWNPEG